MEKKCTKCGEMKELINKCKTCKVKNCKIKPKGNMVICCNYKYKKISKT